MTFAVTVQHIQEGIEGELHWCETEYVEARNRKEAREKIIVDGEIDSIVRIKPVR